MSLLLPIVPVLACDIGVNPCHRKAAYIRMMDQVLGVHKVASDKQMREIKQDRKTQLASMERWYQTHRRQLPKKQKLSNEAEKCEEGGASGREVKEYSI